MIKSNLNNIYVEIQPYRRLSKEYSNLFRLTTFMKTKEIKKKIDAPKFGNINAGPSLRLGKDFSTKLHPQ